MINLETREAVLVATIDRPLQNTIDDRLADAIEGALAQAGRQNAVLLHLRSATPHFCGGADPARVRQWVDAGGCAALLADSARWARLFERIEASPTVVLAEVNGNALGAGLGLALACDLRIAAASSRIGVPEVRVGLLPAGMTIHRMVELAGTVVSQRLLLGGELIDGTEAHRLGLVHWVAPDDALESQAREKALRIARQSPAALREAKRVLASARGNDVSRTAATENIAFGRLLGDDEPRQRIHALLGRLAAAERK